MVKPTFEKDPNALPISELPLGMWKIPHKVWAQVGNRMLICFEIDEATMMNEMGRLAICEDDRVLAATVKSYSCFSKDPEFKLLCGRYCVVSSSEVQSDGDRRQSLHIFDLEDLCFASIDLGPISYEAHKTKGKYRRLSTLEVRDEGTKMILDGVCYIPEELPWRALAEPTFTRFPKPSKNRQ